MAAKLDILFINPASRAQVYQSLGANLAAVENPVWAGLLASYCQWRGLAIDIVGVGWGAEPVLLKRHR